MRGRNWDKMVRYPYGRVRQYHSAYPYGCHRHAYYVTQTIAGCESTPRVPVHVTILPLPPAITGPNIVCVGSTITLSDATTGGTWSSGSTSIATVGTSTGVVTGVSINPVVIYYSVSSGCSVTTVVTVTALPSPITGATSVCTGSTISLSDSKRRSWTSSNSGVATVGLTTGSTGGVAAAAGIRSPIRLAPDVQRLL